MENHISLEKAQHLDTNDPLAKYRQSFVNNEPNLIYVDGNSLGRLTYKSAERIQGAVKEEWGQGLIRSWNTGWYELPTSVGDKIGRLIGAAPGQVVVSDSTSVNLFKAVMAALGERPERSKIITDEMNFPSDLYILQGCVRLLGDRHQVIRVPSINGVTTDMDALYDAIDEHTALVTLSHVTFKSGQLYDARAVTEKAHAVGALVVWDLSHSVGAVPMSLDAWGVDFAVGCTYKYLNGGPGSPAFIYVNQQRQKDSVPPLWGWWGHQAPFAFDLDYQPVEGIQRYIVGTVPVLSLLAMEAALEIPLEAGMEAIRAKSIRQTAYLVELVDDILLPLGFSLGSPRQPERRGSHVSIRHPDGYRINRALIEEMDVLPDFREPDNIRLGLAPLYTSYVEVWEAVARIRQVMETKKYLNYPRERLSVT